MNELTIDVPQREGTTPVSGLLNRPRGADALLVLGHGAGAGMRHPFMANLAAGLEARRIATLCYQFPYMEAGRRRPDHPTRLVRTVRAVVERASQEIGDLPLFVGGKSMGGRIASVAESEDPLGVEGLIFVGFPLHPPGDDGTKAAARAEPLARIDVPMLFLQGTRDALADLDAMQGVCRGLGRRASLHVVDGADHSFHVLKRSGRTDTEAMRELVDTTARWIGGIVGRPR